MEERYKSLAAMKSEPWIDHFKKTVGQPTLWSTTPKPVVIVQSKKSNSLRNDTTSDTESNMPLTVVSPIEQYSEMAEADINETTQRAKNTSVTSRPGKGKQQKRKQITTQQHAAKKLKRVKDIFNRHGKQ